MAAAEGGGEREGPPVHRSQLLSPPGFRKAKASDAGGLPTNHRENSATSMHWAKLLGLAIGASYWPIASPNSERPCRLGCFGSHVSIINIFFQTV